MVVLSKTFLDSNSLTMLRVLIRGIDSEVLNIMLVVLTRIKGLVVSSDGRPNAVHVPNSGEIMETQEI